MAVLTDRDLDSMVDFLWSRSLALKAVSLPVDLFEIAKLQRVTMVDLRPMLPSGGLSCKPSGFVIYLQDLRRSEPLEVPPSGPVADRPTLTNRQRSTFAHELAHTLVFSTSNPPQLRADCPKGAKLEALCHRAARRILMPEGLMLAEVHAKAQVGPADILGFAKRFGVSPELALWRCDDLAALRDSDRAVLFIRRSPSGREEIAGFFCSDWFEDWKGRPDLGMSPSKWLSGCVDENFWSDPNASATFREADEEIRGARLPHRGDAYFVDLELQRASKP